jgi:hypothetical protein
MLNGGATKLISGVPQYEEVDFKVLVKAVYQSSDLLVLNFQKYCDPSQMNIIG